MSKVIHVGVSVRGALHWPDKFLHHLLQDNNGYSLTPSQAKDALMDELVKGHEVLPTGPCDNWDWQHGCRGHEEPKT